MEDIVDYIASDDLPEEVVENIPLQKVAIALSDYEEYNIFAGDCIGVATYFPVWDDDPSTWQKMLSMFPIYRVIDHEWQVWEDGNNLPEIKTIDI